MFKFMLYMVKHLKIKLPLLLSQAKQRSLGRPFATDTTAEEQQQEITR